MPTLSIQGVSLAFGGVVALDDISFEVGDREICALVGPNGAGKSSLFNCITGLYGASAGEIRYDGISLIGTAPHRITRRGIGRTFQNLAFAPHLSVLENVMVADVAHHGLSPFACGLALPSGRRRERALRSKALELLAEFGLEEAAEERPADLPFGTLKRIELARALLLEPSLLLVDEPAGGLNQAEVAELADMLQAVRTRRGASILLVEHHMGFVMSLADRVVVLDGGRKIADDVPSVVTRDPRVIEAYLGVPA